MGIISAKTTRITDNSQAISDRSVKLDPSDKSRVLSDTGLFDIVRCGKALAPVSYYEISAVRRVVASGLAMEPRPDLVIGEEVRMQGGPLVGLIGRLLEIKKSMRLILSVNLLNRLILVEIEQDWVRPIARKDPLGQPSCGPWPSKQIC
jgi:transcription antitermination factor NusG